MKSLALSTAAAVASTLATTTHAWSDNGHMLVGQVAAQLMDPEDVATIEDVLSDWDDEFPNTSKLSTAAVWPDLLKCKGSNCASPAAPAVSAMETWHYIDLPLNANGARWRGQEPSLDLFNDSLGGSATDVLEKTVTSFSTTKSLWAANLQLRNFIHIFGDLHQPLHAVAAVSETNPTGDQGGNLYKFASPCGFSNLHSLWDASAGKYTGKYWSLDTSALEPGLQQNATELIGFLPAAADALNIDQFKDIPYADFVAKVVPSSGSLIKSVVLDSYTFATSVVYTGLDLTYNSAGTIACPPQSYLDWASLVSQVRIATAGKRLSVFLTHFAKQIRALGLDVL